MAPVRAEYKFGDLTRGLMKGAKEQLNKLGQSVTGAAVLPPCIPSLCPVSTSPTKKSIQLSSTYLQIIIPKLCMPLQSPGTRSSYSPPAPPAAALPGDEGYQFGDLTRKTLGSLLEQNSELRQFSKDAVEAMRNYRCEKCGSVGARKCGGARGRDTGTLDFGTSDCKRNCGRGCLSLLRGANWNAACCRGGQGKCLKVRMAVIVVSQQASLDVQMMGIMSMVPFRWLGFILYVL